MFSFRHLVKKSGILQAPPFKNLSHWIQSKAYYSPENNPFTAIDYLVYSAHKTATQTLVATLSKNGFNATFCHTLTNPSLYLAPGSFRSFASHYQALNKRKLVVISVFREPVERHISSFFQWHGADVVKKGLVADRSQSLLSTNSVRALHKLFLKEIITGELRGRRESIEELCVELQIGLEQLAFNPETKSGSTETDFCTIHLFRFDQLTQNNEIEKQVSLITGKQVVQYTENHRENKWYQPIQQEFASTLKLPSNLIERIYHERAGLIELFYPGEFEQLLAQAKERYAA